MLPASGLEPDSRTLTPERAAPPKVSTLLFAAIAVGILLRCLWLTKESLWFDELMSWWISIDWARAVRAEATNPPFYLLLLHGWIGLFGVSEAALRSMSILPSVAALVTTWKIGSMLMTRQAAVLAVIYQSVSTFHIFYAQEARTHALLLFLLSTAFLFLLKALDAPPAPRRWWLTGYAVLVALSMYSHFVATFYLCMHALFVLLVCRRSVRVLVEYAAAAAGAVLLFSPWLLTLLTTAGSGGQFRRYLLLKVPQTYLSFLFGDTLIPLDEDAVQNVRETLTAYAPALAAALMVAVVVGLFAIRALARLPLRTTAAVVLLGVGPVAMSLIVSLAGVPMFDERYVLSSTPFVYFAMALGFIEMWKWAGARPAMRAAAGAVSGVYVLLLGISLFNYYGHPRFGKEQWREAIAHIESMTPPDERPLIVFEPDFIKVGQAYYGRKSIPSFPVDGRTRARLLSSDAHIRELASGKNLVWLVRSHERDDLLLEAFRRNMREEGHFPFPKANRINVHRFTP